MAELTGCIVLVLNGRDKGKMMCIVGETDDKRVLVADGRSRKLAKPKVKSLKHLKLLDAEKVNVNEFCNKTLRRKINGLK